MMIRVLNAGDVEAYIALRREMLGDSPWAFSASEQDDVGLDPVFLRARLGEKTQAIIGAFDAGVLVGGAGLVRERHVKMAHRAKVWGMYVTQRARGSGVGRAIMEAAIAHARSWDGVTSVGLSVSENAPAARRLYERLGFVAWGTEPDALHHAGKAYAEHHMVLRLTDRTF